MRHKKTDDPVGKHKRVTDIPLECCYSSGVGHFSRVWDFTLHKLKITQLLPDVNLTWNWQALPANTGTN